VRRALIGLVAVSIVAAATTGTACDRSTPAGDEPAPDDVTSAARAELPVPRTEIAGAVLDGRIVVVGGLTADGTASDLVHFYDADTDTRTEGPRLPVRLHHTVIVSARDRAWAIGGFTNGPGGSWAESARVWSIGAGDAAWREEIALPAPRGALAAAAADDGTIVAFGGVSAGAIVATTVVLRADATAWEDGPSLDEPREHLAATTIDGRVYAVAGRVASLESNKRTVESWDASGREGSWRREPSLSDTRGGTAAAGRCVAGGEEPGGTIASIECLNDDGDAWVGVADLTTARHGLAVVALAGNLHVIAGGDQPGLFVSGIHEVFESVT
jgi:hypothetical protein